MWSGAKVGIPSLKNPRINIQRIPTKILYLEAQTENVKPYISETASLATNTPRKKEQKAICNGAKVGISSWKNGRTTAKWKSEQMIM